MDKRNITTRDKIDFTEEEIKFGMSVLNEIRDEILDFYNFFVFLQKERSLNFSVILINSDSLKERILKDNLRHRASLINMRTKLKNRIHSFLARYGYTSIKTDIFTQVGIEWIFSLEISDIHSQIIKQSLDHIQRLTETIKEIDKQLQQELKTNDDMKLLTSIPGIGTLSAAFLKCF